MLVQGPECLQIMHRSARNGACYTTKAYVFHSEFDEWSGECKHLVYGHANQMRQDSSQTRANRSNRHVAPEHDMEGESLEKQVGRHRQLLRLTVRLIFIRERCVIKMELQYLENISRLLNCSWTPSESAWMRFWYNFWKHSCCGFKTVVAQWRMDLDVSNGISLATNPITMTS